MDNNNNNNSLENNTLRKSKENNKKKKIFIITTMVALFCGVLVGGYNIMNKKITIVSNGKTNEISTFRYTIDEVIKEQNIDFNEDDFVNIKFNEELKENVSLDTKIEDNMYIDVIKVSKGVISKYKEINFETKVEEDKDLLKGKTKVAQEGKKGKNRLEYDVVYHNGELVDKKFSKETVSEQPVDKVVKKGVKVEEEMLVASSRGGSRQISVGSSSGKHMSVVATAYSGDTITATGTVPKWGTIAVDPRIIPYGTRVYIPQFNQTFVAEDCGGAIKGNKIDIFMNSESSAYSWGRRNIDIYIVS